MKLKVLGCSGGIGGNLHTTSFLLDHDVLIDAGTGVGELSLTELAKIDHIFVTHSHASEDTLDILRQHVFNWKIWPDFSKIPNAHRPYLRYQTMELGQTVVLNGRKITSLPANHVVPAVGYLLDSGKESLVFTGDTTTCDALWKVVNQIENLRYLIIETAFSNSEKDLAIVSKHLCPSLLAEELAKLKRKAKVFITHLKPSEMDLTMQEIKECGCALDPKMLLNNQEFEL
jgi:ribonuclease BN (tRNA processing enzyme)